MDAEHLSNRRTRQRWVARLLAPAWRFLGRLAVVAGSAVLIWPVPAAPAAGDVTGSCSVTGYAARSEADAAKLVSALRSSDPATTAVGGTRLDERPRWVVPQGSRLVLVVDSTEPLTRGRADVVALGQRFRVDSGRGKPTTRYVSPAWAMPDAALVRTFGLHAGGNSCAGQVIITTDRHPLTTVVGLAGLAAAVVCATLAVLLARRRRGRRAVKVLAAGLLGLAAGMGEAAVLHETGTVSPFTRWILAVPVGAALLGVAIALLPHRARIPAIKPIAPPVPPGTMLGRYRLDAVLGSGSTGTVYRATDPTAKRPVAIKVIAADLASDPRFIERFHSEAEIMRQLRDHPHCVRLIDVVEEEGRLGVVSEFVPGVPLRRLIREHGRLTGEQALGVLAGTLRGLAHLHASGLVHRDVKPENILIDEHGDSRLIDYGLVRPGAVTGGPIEGSPSYMSPEQILDRALDRRSDIYACGVVLAELLTGRRPFRGPDIRTVLNAHLGQPPPDLTEDDIAPRLARLVAQALAKDPAERPESAMAFLAELEAAAIEAYQEDWATRAGLGAMTTTILGSSTATFAALSATGAATGAAVTVTPGTVAVGGSTAGAATGGLGKLTAVAAPGAGALVVVAVAVVAVVASAAPARADDVITPAQARAVFASTWGKVRSSQLDPYVSGSALSTVRRYGDQPRSDGLPPATSLPITVLSVVVPHQRSYPAFFIGIGHIDTTSGLRVGGVYVYARFVRASASAPWQMVSLTLEDDSTPVPRFAIGADGYARLLSAAAKRRLLVDPASLPGRYASFGNRSIAAGKPVSDPILLPGPYTTDAVKDDIDYVRDAGRHGVPYAAAQYAAGSVAVSGLLLEGGDALVFFDVTNLRHSSNLAGSPAGAPCRIGNRTYYIFFLEPGGLFPFGHQRTQFIRSIVSFAAIVPAGGTATPAPPGGPPAGVTLIARQYTIAEVKVVPC
jgi:serine/threonine-protein kinase